MANLAGKTTLLLLLGSSCSQRAQRLFSDFIPVSKTQTLQDILYQDAIAGGGATRVAASNGFLELMQELCRRGLYPTRLDASFAAGFGHLHVLKYCVEHGIRPFQHTGACGAALVGHLHVLEYLASINELVLSDPIIVAVAKRGQLSTIKCLAESCNVKFSRDVLELVHGHVSNDILDYMASHMK